MKKKYLKIIGIFAILVVVLLGGFFVYKKNSKVSDENTIAPILYEVTKKGSNNKMYLFGSIHMAKKEDLVFPEYIMDAYNNSHYLACEYNIVKANADFESAQEIAEKMFYQDGSTILNYISGDTYVKLVRFLKGKNLYNSFYDYYKPVFFYSLMSNVIGNDANLKSEAGIDEYFINKAITDNKEILEVESMQLQMDLLLGFSDSLYELAINDIIDNYDDNVKELVDLYANWKSGNEKAMIELNDEDMAVKENYTEEQKEEINEFNRQMVNDRNKTMTDKAIEYFNNNQDVFFMVGTLHIIGEDGIANRLQKEGYIVKRVN